MTNASKSEWNARIYHEVSNPHGAWGSSVINGLQLNGDEFVADVGCGTGRVTAELLEHLPAGRLIAIDRSANMIQEARAHLQPRFSGQATFLKADLLAIQSSDIGEPVDLVFSTATFHWIRDHAALFSNLFSLLRPGGRLVAQCGGGPNLQRHVDRSGTLMRAMPYKPYFEGWESPKFYADQESTADRLRLAGFVDVETTLEAAPAVLEDAQTFTTFLANVIFREHLMQFPNESLKSRFIDALTRLAATDDPPFFLDYWRLNMRGLRPESES